MKCDINGWTSRFEKQNISQHADLTLLTLGSQLYYVFEDSVTAGIRAKEYWMNLAVEDPEEFATIVGEHNIRAWKRGHYAGAGSTQVRSLDDWFDIWLDNPAEQFARYSGEEDQISFTFCSRHMILPNGKIKKYKPIDVDFELLNLFGFIPTVAYRQH